jgi:transcriptional regulator with XRE-family HTH domain
MITTTEQEGILASLEGFGAAIKQARKAQGLTQKQLAKKARVGAETIIRIEQGMSTRTKTMQQIQAVLAKGNGHLWKTREHADDGGAAPEDQKATVDTRREEVQSLLRALRTMDRMDKVMRFVLDQLNEQADPPRRRGKKRSR